MSYNDSFSLRRTNVAIPYPFRLAHYLNGSELIVFSYNRIGLMSSVILKDTVIVF